MVEQFLDGDAACVKLCIIAIVVGWLLMMFGYMKGK